MKRKFSIATLGCKINQIDSFTIIEELKSEGYEQVDFGQEADLVIINTCSVTARAERDARKFFYRSRDKFPDAKIVVTGCTPVINDDLSPFASADLICGNAEKPRFLSLVEKLFVTDEKIVEIAPMDRCRDAGKAGAETTPGRTRAFCKVQDGCSFSCTYCVVPKARGKSRSVPMPEIMGQIAGLGKAGYAEVVLSGIHLGAWGLDFSPRNRLADLLEQLLNAFPQIRFRLSSIEPLEVDDALINLMAAHNRFCKHLHVPLQSGDEQVLKAMNRNYSADYYFGLLEKVTAKVAGVTLGADVIVGFPGETDAQFQNTLTRIEKSPLAHLHVFPYSVRPNTVAATMPGQVDPQVIKKRAAALREVDEKIRTAHYQKFMGKRLSVLCEGRKPDGLFGGVSDNYIPVRFDKQMPEGKIVDVLIQRPCKAGKRQGLYGIVE